MTPGGEVLMWQVRAWVVRHLLPLPGPWGTQMPALSNWLGSSGPSRSWLRHAERWWQQNSGFLIPAGDGLACGGLGHVQAGDLQADKHHLGQAPASGQETWCSRMELSCFLAHPLLVCL